MFFVYFECTCIFKSMTACVFYSRTTIVRRQSVSIIMFYCFKWLTISLYCSICHWIMCEIFFSRRPHFIWKKINVDVTNVYPDCATGQAIVTTMACFV